MLKEAREIKEQIVAQAKSEAEKAAAKVMAEAEQKRDAMMVAAMADIKNQVLDLSIAVAEKVVRKQISTTPDQEMLVNDLVKEIKFN
jgi:F-type H+-transporting ATPase subunit b